MAVVRIFTNPFAKKTGNCDHISGNTVPIFHITSYHSLIQYIGYAKFINRDIGNVYLRGQHALYNSLIPSIFRKVKTDSGFKNRCKHLGIFIKDCCSKMEIINKLNDYSREPLLQHYGIGTRWIDLVDNVWIAIWFGVYDWHTQVFDREYKNIIPRSVSKNEFMYLLLICSDAINEQTSSPGFYKGSKTYTIDLRKACPSTFLRPHAQHALLMRSKDLNEISHADLSSHIVGIAKISVKDAFKWLGETGFVSARSLFPPVNFDHGYGILIEQTPHSKSLIRDYGSIYTVTY